MKYYRTSVLLSLISAFTTAFSQEPDSIVSEKVYTLGEVQIVAVRDNKAISQATNLKYNLQDVSHSLNLLSSVSFANVGGKNETGVYIRGFDNRSVPVFVDGIPVYIPYDGLLDLGRFKTFDYSRIDISKGFSPMALGSNAMGGAINLVSLKPQEKLEIQIYNSIAGGEDYQTGVQVGSKMGRFYTQGSYYRYRREYFPLSGDFKVNTVENGGQRDNSWLNEDNLNLKFGFSPGKTNEYSVNYSLQKVSKGNPVYSGSDPKMPVRYWQWPRWDKQSLYFISNTVVDSHSSLRVRLFYDKFDNTLKSYDDNTYSSQTKRYAFTSIYDDYSLGGNMIFSDDRLKKNNISISAHFKQDHHREYNVGEPVRHFADNTMSIGADDVFDLSERLKLITGLSYNLRSSITAENYNSKDSTITLFPSNKNTALNVQSALRYYFTNLTFASVSIARRTRFATLKDRYSYRLGIAIPNPELNSERALHYDLSFNSLIAKNLKINSSVFYSGINNAIQEVNDVLPDTSQMQNTGKAEFYGVELGTNLKISGSLNLSLDYSYIERNNLSRPDLKFTDVPGHKLVVNVSILPTRYLEMNFLGEYNSERYSTSYGTKADAFDVYHIFLSAHISGFTIRAGINNIFDKNYNYQEGYPEPGRNYFISLTYLFRLHGKKVQL